MRLRNKNNWEFPEWFVDILLLWALFLGCLMAAMLFSCNTTKNVAVKTESGMTVVYNVLVADSVELMYSSDAISWYPDTVSLKKKDTLYRKVSHKFNLIKVYLNDEIHYSEVKRLTR